MSLFFLILVISISYVKNVVLDKMFLIFRFEIILFMGSNMFYFRDFDWVFKVILECFRINYGWEGNLIIEGKVID